MAFEFKEKTTLDQYMSFDFPQLGAVSMLLDAGADMEIQNNMGMAPMDMVANSQVADRMQLEIIDPRETPAASSMMM